MRWLLVIPVLAAAIALAGCGASEPEVITKTVAVPGPPPPAEVIEVERIIERADPAQAERIAELEAQVTKLDGGVDAFVDGYQLISRANGDCSELASLAATFTDDIDAEKREDYFSAALGVYALYLYQEGC